MYYRVLNILIASPWPLPGLVNVPEPRDPGGAFTDVDVVIRAGEVPASLAAPRVVRPAFQAEPGRLILDVPDVLRIAISRGREIVVELGPNGTPADRTAFLLGPAIAAVLQQRDHFLLHASAVGINGAAVLFSGASAVGKSTLAAYLGQAGYQVLADEHCVLDLDSTNAPLLRSFSRRMLLWRDTLDALGFDAEALTTAREGIEKYVTELAEQSGSFVVDSLVLVRHQPPGRRPRLETLSGVEAVRAYRKALYRKPYLQGMGLNQSRFADCLRAATSTRVFELHLTHDLQALPVLVELLVDGLKRPLTSSSNGHLTGGRSNDTGRD